ncbi:MAG: hypothetical protein ACK5GD_10600 [Planctomycetota bacterium]|jgi:hypothetical protein
MSTISSKTTLYVGQWNSTEYVYALNSDSAVASVKQHFAYGDPSEDDYAVGEQWASADNDSGWKIVAKEVNTLRIGVRVEMGSQGDTAHMNWTCPFCGEGFSDEWRPDDTLPVLLMCGCNEQSKFLLGVHEM